jgi:hypothetical protein
MARHSGLLTLAANTADGLLDAAWTFLDGNTAGGWTWAREGTTDAIYGFKDFGSGATAVRRVVWLCGDAAGSTPGLLSGDTVLAAKVYVGAARIAAGSVAWAGWTNAAPVGAGGIGRVRAIATCSATTAVKLELFISDHEISYRLEGNGVTVARVGRAGALSTALASARGGATDGDPDGLRTGVWVSGLSNPIPAGWCSGAEATGVYAANTNSAGQAYGWLTRSDAVVDTQSRPGCWPAADSVFSGGNIRPVPSAWQLTTGAHLGYDTGMMGACDYSSATKVLSNGAIETAYVLCRDSSATTGEAILLSATTLTP